MKLCILGATGRTGIPLVRQALDADHSVKALVRSPTKMTINHPNLEIVQGDVLDTESVEKAVEGTEAVLCVLGHAKASPDDLQTLAMRAVTAAMKKHNVRRLLDLTGAGVRDPEDRPKVFDRLVVAVLKLVSPKVLQDGVNHAAVIRESGLEWTIVRAPMLTDGPRTGNYRVGLVGASSGSRISRADIADFMVKEIQERRHIGRMPMLSY